MKIWAFGIMMWEILEYAAIPYSGMTNKETVDYIKKGERLSKPTLCPTELYTLMLRCWESETSKRPDFSELLMELKKIQSKEDPESTTARLSSFLPTGKGSSDPSPQSLYNNQDGNYQVVEGNFPKAHALYSFVGQKSGDLSFSAGQIITIFTQQGNWWSGQVNGVQGSFPSNYVKLITEEAIYN